MVETKQSVREILAEMSDLCLRLADALEPGSEEIAVGEEKNFNVVPMREEKNKDTADGNTEDLESMGYPQLKKLAAERGIKNTNVSRATLIAQLRGTEVEDADEDEPEENVEAEEPESETDGEDLTAKVTELLKDVDTEEIADFLTENGIGAKGKRPTLIAKIVQAINDGDISLEDLEVEDDEDDEPEEKPAPKKKSEKKPSDDKKADKGKPAKKSEPKIEIPDPKDGYTKKGKNWVADTGNELLDLVSSKRMDAYLTSVLDIDTALSKGKLSVAEVIKEVTAFYGEDSPLIEDAGSDEDFIKLRHRMELLLTDDDGERHELEDPYEVNGQYVCCGEVLVETDDGYACEICGNEYEAD